jgi:hypothetical protein
VTRTRWTGKRRETGTYRYAAIPLRDAVDALTVNWCEITTTGTNGNVLYQNAFATTLAINDGNVVAIVADGSGRWKIENEHNNTLKTKAATSSITWARPSAPVVLASEPHYPGLVDPYRVGMDGRQVPTAPPEDAFAPGLVQRDPKLDQLPVL